MSLPTFTTEQVRTAIKKFIAGDKSCSGVEIFTEFPQDITVARHGIYIDDPVTSSRTPYQLALNYGGNIYIATDSFQIVFITFQGDNLMNIVTDAITNLVTDNVLFDGYHERDFSMVTEFRNRAEYRTIDFELKRISFQ